MSDIIMYIQFMLRCTLCHVWLLPAPFQGHKRLVLTGVVSLFNELDRTIPERDSPSDGCEG